MVKVKVPYSEYGMPDKETYDEVQKILAESPVFDEDSSEAKLALRLAPSNENEAKKVLLEAAKLIGQGLPLTRELAYWLESAIKTAVTNPAKLDPETADTGLALLVGLHLRSYRKRPSRYSQSDVYDDMDILMWPKSGKKGLSQRKASIVVAKKLDIGESTARKHYRNELELKIWSARAAFEFYLRWREEIEDNCILTPDEQAYLTFTVECAHQALQDVQRRQKKPK